MKINYFIIILILFNQTSIFGQSNWFFTNPYPDAQNITGIYFADNNTGLITGDAGRIMKTTNGGINWFYNFLDLSLPINKFVFINNLTGFFITSEQFYKTTNFGNNWQLKFTFTSGNYINSFSFPINNLGYICCSGGIIYRTTNTGENWVQISDTSIDLSNICFSDSLTGFAFTNFVGPNSVLYRTSNGGNSWIGKNFSSGDTLVDFKQILFLNGITGFATAKKSCDIYPSVHWSRAEIYKTTNKGLNWNTNFYFNGIVPTQIYFADTNKGMLATNTLHHGIYRTMDGGYYWEAVYANDSTGFYSVFLLKNSNYCFAGGDNGLFLSSTNFGINWANNHRIITIKDIHSSSFINPNTGYIIGYQGLFAKTTDAGNTWNIINSLPNLNFRSASFTSEQTGFAAGPLGDTVYSTMNGGISWQHIWCNTGTQSLYYIQFVNALTGYASGYPGKVIKTTNGGINWISLNTSLSSDLISLFFINENLGYVANYSGCSILKTTNGGNSFSNQYFASNYFECIKFINANTGFASTGSGMVYSTTNGGVNWISHWSGSASQINYIDFVNANTGFAVGNGIYKTTNGGINWSRQLYFSRNTFLWNISVTSPDIISVFGGAGAMLKTTNGGNIFLNKIDIDVPNNFFLYQNYPNPFNPTTKIKYQIAERSPTRAFGDDNAVLKVYDLLGREVETLVNEKQSPGIYEIDWNASRYPSGIYFYKLEAGDYKETKRMILIK